MSGPVVYIPNDVHHQFTNLHKWGTVKPLFKTHIYPDTADSIAALQNQVRTALADFRRDVDFIGLLGDPALIALTMMVLGFSLSTAKVRVLKWDRHLGAYYPIVLEVL